MSEEELDTLLRLLYKIDPFSDHDSYDLYSSIKNHYDLLGLDYYEKCRLISKEVLGD